ncbi:hypothetical protein MUA26_03885 [Staphylococcus sp. IVB6246]|uniref:hypothetical protein n=1 Tax=Staphylococcus sp. IVB6246 TaxID=2989772 RepID=UPI0021D0DD54|nr:hypothetical protein [Staphylococcus sp. IVB6246]UXR70281.1 hypothetical protein MUA26_03885 [Staphylococcus sp. IVB6246]
MRNLTNNVNQRYRVNTTGKTPTQLQKELEDKGVKVFVVKVNHDRVTILVERSKVKKNRESFINGRS